MKIEARKWLTELAQDKSDRKRTSVYVSETILNEFKEICGEGNVSKMLEKLMREFNQNFRDSGDDNSDKNA